MDALLNRKDLRAVKAAGAKRLEGVRFATVRKGKLPKPLDKLAGANLMATPLYEVGGDLRVAFVAKTAAARSNDSFTPGRFRPRKRDCCRWREWTTIRATKACTWCSIASVDWT